MAGDAALLGEAHVVALPLPYTGHIHPLMELSKQLAAQGVRVSFVNAVDQHERMVESLKLRINGGDSASDADEGVPYLHEQGLDIRLLSAPCPLPDPRKTSTMADLLDPILSMQKSFEQMMARLMQQQAGASRPKVTCLVADVRIPFAQEVADKFGVPRVAFWSQSAASFACTLQVSKGYRPPADSCAPIDTIAGVPALRRHELGPFLTLDDSDPTFDFVVRPFQQLHQASAVVLNTFDELEPDTLASLRQERPILAVGPLLPASYVSGASPYTTSGDASMAPEQRDCLEWLDTQAPSSVLYISFGTVYTHFLPPLHELAAALEAAQQPFLWVLRPQSLPLHSAPFPDSAFLGRTRRQGRIVSWAPQMHVLSHRSVGGFLSHCGWNSTVESICRGVPILGWPLYADQMLNNRCIVDAWKIGLGLDPHSLGSVSSMELQAKINELMKGQGRKEAQENASKWRDAAMRAQAVHGGSSTKNKSLLLTKLGLQHHVRERQLEHVMIPQAHALTPSI